MTKLPKAPRPCTLWGKTFESNHVTSYGVRAIDDIDVFPASRMFQARITLGDESRLYAANHHEIRMDAHRDMQEAITAIYNALHPPLCMKHALEIGYEFEQGQRYIIKRKLNAVSQFAIFELRWGKPYFETKHDVFKEAEGVQWFYPVNEYDQPNHGEAESYVKPWEAKA